ncbi:MAG: ABC transporter permease subunit, partial [Anaerococcus obesiensis]
MDKNKKTSYLVSFVLVLVSFAIIQILILSGIIDSYWQSILFLLCINIILSISLNITVGNLGQITLGHAGFMSIGAYSAGIFLKTGIIEGIPGFFIALLIGGLFAFLFSLAIGIPVLRLNGD